MRQPSENSTPPAPSKIASLPARLLRALTPVAMLALGCAPKSSGATLPQLQVRASYDLACPPGYLSLVHLDRRTKLVSGCGGQQIYVEICDEIRGRSECTWLLNTAYVVVPSVRQRAAAAGQSPQIYQNPGPRPEAPVRWPFPELPFPEEWTDRNSHEYLPSGL